MRNVLMALALVSALAFSAAADRPTGSVQLTPTYNATPNPAWEPGLPVFLYIDFRRDANGDAFTSHQFPGTYPRTAGQHFSVEIPNVSIGEKIVVQGYMCAQGTTDCFPSDGSPPATCYAVVHVLGQYRPSCQPTFTWTGGAGAGGVSCSATCN